jgi:hypothetical protein
MLVGYCGVECSKEEEAHEDPPSTQYFQQLLTLLWNSEFLSRDSPDSNLDSSESHSKGYFDLDS